MNLVENDQFVFVLRQVKLRIGELCTVRRQFEVEIYRLLIARFRKRKSKRSLAHLSRTNEGDGREMLQSLL